jgi:uncharacterized iron-regulated membrane protein
VPEDYKQLILRHKQAPAVESVVTPTSAPTSWQTWIVRPEKLWVRQILFQMHFWLGTLVGAYVTLMSLTGSLIVFRNEFANRPAEWLVRLHRWAFVGSAGHTVNAMGALSLVALSLSGAVIWWPGRAHWHRSLTIEWRARLPRVTWDAHSALGFWCLPFVMMWSVSGLYLAEPQSFDGLLRLDPQDRFVDAALFVLAQLHFGRFNRLTEMVWALIGLVPALLAITGVFICCRRVIWHKPSNPKHAA